MAEEIALSEMTGGSATNFDPLAKSLLTNAGSGDALLPPQQAEFVTDHPSVTPTPSTNVPQSVAVSLGSLPQGTDPQRFLATGQWLSEPCVTFIHKSFFAGEKMLGMRCRNDDTDDRGAAEVLCRSAQDAILLNEIPPGETRPLEVRRAVLVNLASALISLGAMGAAAYYTQSIALLMGCFSAFLSISACCVLFIASLLSRSRNPKDHPGGRSTFEPLALVVFATFLASCAFQGGIIAVRQLMLGPANARPAPHTFSTPKENTWLIVLTCVVLIEAVKSFYCHQRSRESRCLRALAKDSALDSIQGIFVTLVAWIGFIPPLWRWWIDPAASVVVCIFVTMVWFSTVKKQIKYLSGFRARSSTYTILQDHVMAALGHRGHLEAIRAYHVGERLFVEADVVFNQGLGVTEIAGICASIKQAIKCVENIEKCLVNVLAPPQDCSSRESQPSENASDTGSTTAAARARGLSGSSSFHHPGAINRPTFIHIQDHPQIHKDHGHHLREISPLQGLVSRGSFASSFAFTEVTHSGEDGLRTPMEDASPPHV